MQDFQKKSAQKNTAGTLYTGYRTRIAPTPSGFLHFGHAATFLFCYLRTQKQNGSLIFRLEDIDPDRSKPEYCHAALDDLKFLDIQWNEGPYRQSQLLPRYTQVWKALLEGGHIYPSPQSRKEIGSEKIFPPTLRQKTPMVNEPGQVNWRFRVPDGRNLFFDDIHCGKTHFCAGKDFGDFIIWRKNGWPSYELAVVSDDHYMNINEVIRAQDLLLSTARQLLIYEALGWQSPAWLHLPLLLSEAGDKLSKSTGAYSIRAHRTIHNPHKSKTSILVTALEHLSSKVESHLYL